MDIQCGGALVRPGDVVVGDDDGCVVVPSWFAEECIERVEETEGVERYIKEKIVKERVRPGKYYPPTEATRAEWRKVQAMGCRQANRLWRREPCRPRNLSPHAPELLPT